VRGGEVGRERREKEKRWRRGREEISRNRKKKIFRIHF
jgi:hypothetical protein